MRKNRISKKKVNINFRKAVKTKFFAKYINFHKKYQNLREFWVLKYKESFIFLFISKNLTFLA